VPFLVKKPQVRALVWESLIPDWQRPTRHPFGALRSLCGARRAAAQVRPGAQPLTVCPVTGTLNISKFPRLRQPDCG